VRAAAAGRDKEAAMAEESQWWWSIERGQAEYGPKKFLDPRLGPYATQEEAEHAMEKVKERNEAWDNDPVFGDNA
jgi:hypothetical protein